MRQRNTNAQALFMKLGAIDICFHNCGVNSCPKSLTILDMCCLRRPDPVQLSKVPATFRKVIESGVALEVMRIGTSLLRASESPTTLVRVCSSAYGHRLSSSGCPSDRLLPSDL